MDAASFGRWRFEQRKRSLGQRLADLTGVDTVDTVGQHGDVSEGSALAEIEKINRNPNHPYWRGDKDALKRVSELYAQAYPQGDEA